MLLLVLLTTISTVHSLTCYNGGRLLSTSAVGESVEECPPSAYCYNMTANVAFFVDAIKAGCSTWRCMFARDTCIRTTFQMIPVSFCCCSQDRCNVAENLAHGSITGENGRFGQDGRDSSNIAGNAGGWGGGNNGGANQDGYGDNANDNDYNGRGNNNDGQTQVAWSANHATYCTLNFVDETLNTASSATSYLPQKDVKRNTSQNQSGKNNTFHLFSSNYGRNAGGWGRGDSGRKSNGYNDNNNNNYNGWGNNYDVKTTIYPRLPSDPDSRGSRWDPKQIKDKFNDFDVDNQGDGTGGDEVFEKVDVRFTTRPPRQLISYDRAAGTSTSRQGSTGGEGREIELDV